MFEANLLIHLESFDWPDLSIDRSDQLNNLSLAVDYINNNNDKIYSHPNGFTYKMPWGFFYDIFSFDGEFKNMFCPWLTHDFQKILLKLFNRTVTPQTSHNITDMDGEFANENNGMLGVCNLTVNKYVFDPSTWHALHSLYVKDNPTTRTKCFKYFKKFYKPELTVDANSIKTLIRRRLAHDCFERLDTPTYTEDDQTLHGERVQMHFKNGSALNINGEWKHGTFNIPKEAKEQLIEWGFLLPD